MADLGYAAIITAFVVAVYAAVAAFVGSKARIHELWLSARNALFVVFGLTSVASAILVYSFITNYVGAFFYHWTTSNGGGYHRHRCLR